ncbi:hypothetical protein [Deinococcus wulumuqiensis]|uniref:hypothetical protein n=1 Tax=Deinococcus wulumuqiensis TaxID=980427 RepID=UPI0024328F06|nr:hypothetical protein [Deinococcus wulumuqiensis]
MTQPSTPATGSANRNAPNVRFGRNARMYVALDDGSGQEPAFNTQNGTWAYFCATSQLEIGGQKGSETVNNFCTGGNDVDVNDGSETNTLTTGDATWAEDDSAITMLERAYETDARVWYRIYPLGLGDGKPVYRGLLEVKEWKLTIPSKGLIKMTNGLTPLGKPEKGTVDAQGVFTKTDFDAPATRPQSINGGALVDNVAVNLPALAANQEANYTLTSTAAGDLTVVTAGSSASRTVSIVDSTGAVKATGTDGATYAAAPAATYTVRVSGAQASTGGNVTADFATA